MRGFKINLDGRITEIDVDLQAEFGGTGITYGYSTVSEDHVIHYDDEGMLTPDPHYFIFDPWGRIPLPAYVFGSDKWGEVCDATIDMDTVCSLLSNQGSRRADGARIRVDCGVTGRPGMEEDVLCYLPTGSSLTSTSH